MLRRLDALDAILDVSAGDSFTDLYGAWRFRAVALPKRIALALRRPLFLLPQTYGPFRDPRRAEAARRILRGVQQAWARDARSLELVRELLGSDFDPERHRLAVDLAFGLPALEPVSNAVVESVMSARAGASVVLGLNVSGLLWHAPGEASSTFAIRGSYRDLAREILRTLLAVSGARVLLVPHVVPPCDVLESDVSACEALRGELPADAAARVAVAPALANPTEVKWVIGQTDWFCGTRMHACIAALSQGIPTAGIAYSDKALGVFESVGAGEWLLDARAVDSGKIAERVAESLLRRAETAVGLRAALPGVRRTLDEALRAIAAAIP
jgi:polysaccharide pyruvyl transferase WcaK-like protein